MTKRKEGIIEYVNKNGELVTTKISDYDDIAYYKDFIIAKGKIVTRKVIDTEDFSYIEGIGTVTEEGSLDLEGLIKTLLQERYLRYL
ncbi:hypothetical protein QUF86_20195 [Peribacillus sp. NJ11]|uniref:hypothetical protein n=1 Tax=Peribacillus sp. NJ11 TaxID=3055861 RepID=UPI0025A1797C|nr:hypothetical protein [Peribacillus sp. NJ11]MDM5223016.1 hypothetical protein [Peribacillus sp. NJ11]